MTNYEKILCSYTNLSDLLLSLTDSLATATNIDEITTKDMAVLDCLVNNLSRIGGMTTLDGSMKVGEDE